MEPCNSLLDAWAELLLYPEHDHNLKVQSCIDLLEDENPDVHEMVVQYAVEISSLSLAELEELYIKTFDLNKSGTLDLGWHLFGEDYNRGLFLVKLRQYLQFLQIPETGELPDHVSQVLRILSRMSRDEANLFAWSCVIPSLEIIGEWIAEDNPHHRLIGGLIRLLRSRFEMPAGLEEPEMASSPYVELPIIQ